MQRCRRATSTVLCYPDNEKQIDGCQSRSTSIVLFRRIYRAATEQTRSLRLGQKLVSSLGDGEVELTLRIHRGGGGGSTSSASTRSSRLHKSCTYHPKENGHRQSNEHSFTSPDNGEQYSLEHLRETGGANSPDGSTKVVSKNIKNFSISRKLCKFAKEKKAAKTLGIVMGVFIVCWLPFFVNNLLSGFCGVHCIAEPVLVNAIVTWLGWINSAMNPVIYACWAKDFRRAFTRILCSCCPRRWRMRYQTGWRGGIAQGYHPDGGILLHSFHYGRSGSRQTWETAMDNSRPEKWRRLAHSYQQLKFDSSSRIDDTFRTDSNYDPHL